MCTGPFEENLSLTKPARGRIRLIQCLGRWAISRGTIERIQQCLGVAKIPRGTNQQTHSYCSCRPHELDGIDGRSSPGRDTRRHDGKPRAGPALTNKERNKKAHAMNGNGSVQDEITLKFSNVTSARQWAVQIARDALDGIHMIAEHTLAEDQMTMVKGLMKTQNGDAYLGPSIMGQGRARNGVGIVAGPPFAKRVRPLQIPDYLRNDAAAGRVAGYAITIARERTNVNDSGETVAFLIVGYGDVTNAQAAEDLLQNIGHWVFDLGEGHPIFVGGDFNRDAGESQTILGWRNGIGSLYDVAEVFHAIGPDADRPMEATSSRGNRRIDYIFANEPALSAVKSFYMEETYATHKTLVVTLNLKAFAISGWKRRKLMELPQPNADIKILEHDIGRIRAWKQARWNTIKGKINDNNLEPDARRNLINEMAEIWSTRAEYLIVKRGGQQWTSARHQRGKLQGFEKFTTAKISVKANKNDVGDMDQVQGTKITQYLRALRKTKAVLEAQDAERLRLWRATTRYVWHALARDEPEKWGSLDVQGNPTDAQVQKLYTDVENALNRCQRRMQGRRRAEWDKRMRTNARWPWISQKFAAAPVLVKAVGQGPQGEDIVTAGIHKICKSLEEFWTKIWKADDRDRQGWDDLVLASIPAFEEVPLPAITQEDLKDALSQMGGAWPERADGQ